MAGGGPLPEKLEPADLEFCDGAQYFLQSGFWGAFKARFGWTPLPFRVRWEGGAETPLLVITRPLAPGFSFAYAPWGPQLPPESAAREPPEGGRVPAAALLARLAQALRPHLPRSAGFIRFDPPWFSEGTGIPAPAVGSPLVKAPFDVQAPDTVLVDLSPPEEGILARMHTKWSYNIRLASRKGVALRRADAEELSVFYALFQETARRDRLSIHSLDYYRTLFACCRDYPAVGRPEVRLYLAGHEGDAVGAVITLFRSGEGVYLYGATSDQKRNLMASYALQWQAMKDAREYGCVHYDLFGIPPSGDPHHPMAGLYRFKTGFGGRIIHRPGSWDYPCRPLGAFLFRTAEKSRKALRDWRKKPH
jgi:lipid II:glycine glycyltransferase (peptidoglycan interpeptide bridge formation enzyme)